MSSMLKPLSPNLKPIPIDIVGGNTFGRYPKISLAQTWNMIESDKALVPFAGYRQQLPIAGNSGHGRAIYSSAIFDKIVAVIEDGVYLITVNLDTNGNSVFSYEKINSIATSTGSVYIAENLASQIAICDLQNIYIFNYSLNTFTTLTSNDLGFIPGYISFHETYFISVDLTPGINSGQAWRLSLQNDGTSWPAIAFYEGGFQLKADTPVAVIPMPSKSNEVLVIGNIVTQSWYNTGSQLFPYQLNTFSNLDYGTLNAATICYNENVAIWLAQNQVTGPLIVYTDGNTIENLTTDGIAFLLASLKFPNNSYANLFKQDGHLIYILTFTTDNLTIGYDFKNGKFFYFSDQYQNYHIMRSITSFNNNYYFVSHKDGNFYELSSTFTDFYLGLDHDGNPINWEIPRIRITSPIRQPDSTRFVLNSVFVTLEQGQTSNMAVDITTSKNGGVSFGSWYRKWMNNIAIRPNRLTFWNLGSGNDITLQFRFYGYGRFVVIDAMGNIFQ